jgi:hypothetical protein
MAAPLPILIAGGLAAAVVIDYGVKNVKGAFNTSATAATTGGATTSTGSSSGSGKVAKVPVVGSSEYDFARAFLTSIGAPLNKTNIDALNDWWNREESGEVLVPGHGGENNPFEVTTSGDANVPTLGSVNSSGVKSYATPQEGVEAAIGYFQQYGPGVLNAFRQGESIPDIEQAVADLGPNAFGSDTSTPWGQ